MHDVRSEAMDQDEGFFDQSPADKLSTRSKALEEAEHWPCGASLSRRILDPGLIETHAAQILASAVGSGRLVAFAGAGLTMAHGRMTWAQLLERLYDKLQSGDTAAVDGIANWRRAAWERLNQWIWPDPVLSFRKDKHNYTITAQLFEEFWLTGQENPSSGKADMRVEVANCLGSSRPRLQEVVRAVCRDGNAVPTTEPSRDEARARQPITTYLKAIEPKPIQTTAATPSDIKSEVGRLSLLYADTLSAFGTTDDSPLSLLVNQLQIRRFLTTNYDHEIENALTAFDYPELRLDEGNLAKPAHYGTRHTSAVLRPHLTASAIRFAADGPRRHASVLHLHGDVSDPRSLIITEPDYQHLYVDKHSTHDLVQNAINVAFAANPLLFVGSDVGEDDIMRPLRQFVTGAAHQRDRKAVALLPATRSAAQMVAQKLELLLRYGVHAIHYGFHYQEVQQDGKRPKILPWVQISFQILDRVEERALEIMQEERGPKNAEPASTPTDAGAGNSCRANSVIDRTEFESLPVPSRPEGVDGSIEVAQALLTGLATAIDSANEVSEGRASVNAKPAALHLMIFAQELRSAILTYFFSARLTRIRRQIAYYRDSEVRLPMPVLRTFADYEANSKANDAGSGIQPHYPVVYHRHRVVTKSASEKLVPNCVFRLKNFIGQCPDFTAHRGRRTVVVSSRRGSGKGTLFDALGEPRVVHDLVEALGGYGFDDLVRPLILHFNLSFSDEVAGLTAQAATLIRHVYARPEPEEKSVNQDLLESLAKALDALGQEGVRHPNERRRCLLMLGNAGVLFDAKGNAKSGQVARLLSLLGAPRYADMPMDILMFCEEQQIPRQFRISLEGRTLPSSLEPERWNAKWSPEPRALAHRGFANRAPKSRAFRVEWERSTTQASAPHGMVDAEWRPAQRRLRRLNVRAATGPKGSQLVYPLPSPDAQEIWDSLKIETSSPLPSGNNGREQLAAPWEHLTYRRLATTVAFAFALTAPKEESTEGLKDVLRPLASAVPDNAAERVIEIVLDGWFQRHLRREKIHALGRTAFKDIRPVADSGWQELSQASWKVLSEILWHLSVFSHPVEPKVLIACEAIRTGLREVFRNETKKKASDDALRGGQRGVLCDVTEEKTSDGPDENWLADRLNAMLVRMVEWCLVFLIEPRPGDARLAAQKRALNKKTGADEHRFTVHRQIQKHFLRQAGGRNIETVSWDQFTTTLYASQPDEAPVFARETHVKLVRLVQSLSGYPCTDALDRGANGVDPGDWETRIVRLRAAYFLIRSTFSLGVIAHSTGVSTPAGETGPRAMEEYALLVRWILREAVRIEGDGHSEKWRRVFFAGEIVWLYNECGVIRLAQGKLEEAERMLTLAEAATRRLEPDDSGSMHVRVRLQAALTQIERGRPSRARAMLQPIAERATGHEVPPLLARFYIGLIEHIGGNYRAADQRYREAADGFGRLSRARALAMVMLHQADLHRDLHPNDLQGALGIAHEALAIAQQGGHEDVRIIASLTEARLRVEARTPNTVGLFETLSFAEQYADRMDMPRIACVVFELRARLLFNQGETHMAAAQASESLEIAALYDLKLMKARALLTLANIYAARGDVAGTRELIEFGRELATSADYYSCVRGFYDLELTLGVPVSASASASSLRSHSEGRPSSEAEASARDRWPE